MYDDSNTDSCDVTVIATGIGSKDAVPNNYVFSNQNVRKGSNQSSSYKSGYQSSAPKNSAQSSRPAASRPANTGSSSRTRQDNVEIPSFLRQPRR